ncbi:MAG: HEPN domain-containing protein [Candidatus Wallbacteria bacterium]|nr:HEPN domain-containing protein [Candidatus Wallbacteria bacterium]
MDLHEIADYWHKLSKEDFSTADTLFRSGKFVPAMFFTHLALEKMLKYLYVRWNSTEAPHPHNLLAIAGKIGCPEMNPEKLKVLAGFSAFNITARYDDYKLSFHQVCDREFAEKHLSLCKELLQWLESLQK